MLKAEGADQALQIVRSQAPIDVVLSDIHMPGMLGMDLVREIARLIPQTACILIIGFVSEPQNLPFGVPLLLKPISLSDLTGWRVQQRRQTVTGPERVS